MALKNYSATSLTGGGSGSLDSIDGTNLQDKDSCMVFSAATFYFYTLDDNSGAAESSPDVIAPDTNAGNKRWILIAALGAGGIIYLSNAGLYLADTDASHDLIFKAGSDLTADRILTFTTGDAARTITLSGNPTLADWFDQAVKAASSPTFANLTITNATDHGILLGSGAGAITPLGVATHGQLPIGSTGADPVLATLTGTANQITVTNAAGSITLSIPANLLIPTVLTIPNEGLHILDTNASHDLIIKAGSDLTLDRILTITTGDAARTITLNANLTLSAYGASLMDDADASAAQTTLGISAFVKTTLNDADASTFRTTIGCPSDPAAGTAGLRTLGTTAIKACAGNDARLSDARPPTSTSVGTGHLKTSTQSQNYDIASGASHKFTLTGGQYCLWYTCKGEGGGVGTQTGGRSNVTGDYATVVSLYNNYGSPAFGYVVHRYITSSGEVNWFFVLRDKATKEIIGMSIAPDHPCFGNGGKPLLVSHPFGNYDESKHEIIVINPSLAEIEQMELETIVDDETKPDKDLLEVITENYEIDENSSPAWPNIPVTVGLPKHIKDKKTGKKVLADYRFMGKDDVVEPIKKKIPKPDYIEVKSLKRKKHGGQHGKSV